MAKLRTILGMDSQKGATKPQDIIDAAAAVDPATLVQYPGLGPVITSITSTLSPLISALAAVDAIIAGIKTAREAAEIASAAAALAQPVPMPGPGLILAQDTLAKAQVNLKSQAEQSANILGESLLDNTDIPEA